MRVRRGSRLTPFVISLTVIGACGGSDYGSSQTSSPSSVPAPSPIPAPPPATPTPDGFRLSGTVLESTPQGPRAVSGGHIFFWVGSRSGGQVSVDTAGRYVIAGLAPGPIVRLTWMPGLDRLDLHQPCPANLAMPAADAQRDIEVVGLDSRDFRYDSPTLSGIVYESTANGRRPLPHTRVLYSIDESGGFDAYADTDTDGRYVLCRIPRGRGRLGAGDCNDAVFWFPVEVNGDTFVDADLRPFKEACR